jgi:hypothetical protein
MSSERARGRLVIGLGSGRSGTASLTSLLNRQPGGLCFHELNPACAVFQGNAQAPLNTVREFRQILQGGDKSRLTVDYSRPASVETYRQLQSMSAVNLIGDIAFYYLNYVDDLLLADPDCVFVCIRREREETVQSWLQKSSIKRWPSLWWGDRIRAWLTRTPFYTAYNYWQEHDGSYWKKDPVWDSAFPKFQAASRVQAIGMYWDTYYAQAETLQQRYPQHFRIFDISALSHPQGQREILAFIGLDDSAMVVGQEAHLHKSA